jgi:predicted glycosyltransferase
MKILFDIKHPAQLNLFKGLAKQLQDDGWQVVICYLNRGKLPAIVEREYADFNLIPVGSSAGTKWSIFWDGNVRRTKVFVNLINKYRFNICVAASSAPLALACKLTGTPILQFYDDPERKRINQINAILSNKIYFPPIVSESRLVGVFNCLKEWSYLSPAYFHPDTAILDCYGVRPYEYVFIREVSNKSFNYMDQEDAIVCGLSSQIDPDMPVLLSLEDKSIKEKFPSHWTHLQEPIGDIHSLIFYSRALLSSGDSMAREGAMLGVPSIYCGIRDMRANQLLIDKGLLQHLPGELCLKSINELVKSPFDRVQQIRIREQLLKEWDDMIVFMVIKINQYKK